MDSFEMPPERGVRSVKFRLKRLNPETLDPGQYVLMGARSLAYPKMVQFPCVLQVEVDGGDWVTVDFVNGSLEQSQAKPVCKCNSASMRDHCMIDCDGVYVLKHR